MKLIRALNQVLNTSDTPINFYSNCMTDFEAFLVRSLSPEKVSPQSLCLFRLRVANPYGRLGKVGAGQEDMHDLAGGQSPGEAAGYV